MVVLSWHVYMYVVYVHVGNEGYRPVYFPADTASRFEEVASPNTRKNVETCGILAGKLVSTVDDLYRFWYHLKVTTITDSFQRSCRYVYVVMCMYRVYEYCVYISMLTVCEGSAMEHIHLHVRIPLPTPPCVHMYTVYVIVTCTQYYTLYYTHTQTCTPCTHTHT